MGRQISLIFLLLFSRVISSSAFIPPYCRCLVQPNNHQSSPSKLHSPSFKSTSRHIAIAPIIETAFESSGVQKVLELGVIAAIGSSLRDKLNAKAITDTLINALVPAVIASSLSTLTISSEMGKAILAGVALALIQLFSGELASRYVIGNSSEEEKCVMRRTAALQLGTMAPALSVFSFTQEFVGSTYAALAALADIPTKLYTLVLIPYYLRFRGEARSAPSSEEGSVNVAKLPLIKRVFRILTDPFNLAIVGGLILATLGKPISSLGFFGKAIGSMATAQTAILFLLIGVKLKFGGERPKLCLRLLLARHGICNLIVSALMALFLDKNDSAARLASVLSSHAACSIIAFGQMTKVSNAGVQGYDTDLAFDLVALSFPLTVLFNTIACLAGSAYVDVLPVIGSFLLALSALLGKTK